MVQIPADIAKYFSIESFIKYPIIEIPQHFHDDRGDILNLADGKIGDVSVITSAKNAIRANHLHQKDWHLCFLISGEFEYAWKDSIQDQKIKITNVQAGQMIFTPPQVPHQLTFIQPSQFVTISKLSRVSELYEQDTTRFRKPNFEK